MLNHVEYPSSVKEGTETPGAFDQNGQRFYVLDRLQEQASRIRYLLDTTVFFRDQLEACQAAGNAEAAQSTYLSLSSGRIGIANGVRSLKPLLLELEHPAASICEALVDQISSFELMTRDYSKFSGVISRFLDALPSYHTALSSYIAERVRQRFDHLDLNRVSISLYEVSKTTGEVRDVFKFNYEDRPYVILSLSEKIKAGLEVSELLKKIAGINYPVFIDNGESVPVIDNVRPSGQTFISQVVKNEQLRVEILGAAPAGRSEQAA